MELTIGLFVMLCFGVAFIALMIIGGFFRRYPTHCMLLLLSMMFVLACVIGTLYQVPQ